MEYVSGSWRNLSCRSTDRLVIDPRSKRLHEETTQHYRGIKRSEEEEDEEEDEDEEEEEKNEEKEEKEGG